MTGNSSKYEKLGKYISKWAMAFLKTLTMNVGRCRKWPAWPRDTSRINLKNIGHELPDLDHSLNNVLLWSLLHQGFCCNLVHETGYLKKDKIHLSPFISQLLTLSYLLPQIFQFMMSIRSCCVICLCSPQLSHHFKQLTYGSKSQVFKHS